MSVFKDGSPAARSNMALAKRLSVNAPTIRHRFNKEGVHIRSMYRSLYPSAQRVVSDYLPMNDDDASSEEATSVMNNQKSRTLKQAGIMQQISQGASQSSKREAMRKSLIPHDDPLTHKIMQTGHYIPQGTKQNIL